ncbi:MAG: DegT/DnrJ/EryC1/StrS family aminotransferase [Candidatus Omnitrophica bacterium]|nr:DegT/DnrJ/EryC1/StrS family aminotransferase [Candidatus Omnitrophota bacterium]
MTSKQAVQNQTSIPYADLMSQHAELKQELLAAVSQVLEHSQFILGPEVEAFEKSFSQLCGVRYAVAVNSGTDALVLAMRVLGIGAGDEVITVPNSFVATSAAIVLVGAKPVFVDVRDDCNMDPAKIEAVITSRTKAILPVHLTGRPSDMDPILHIAEKNRLHVVEDAAQAVCAEYRGRKVGSFGTMGCFSLHPLKTLNACGDGGILTTNDKRIYENLKMLRNLGLENRDSCKVWSHNTRLDTLQAAILLVKLKHLNEWTQKRRQNANVYRNGFKGINSIRIPPEQPYEKCVYHTFVIQADRRDELKSYLSKNGVETAIHYPIPIHLQPCAISLGYRVGSFPMAERQANEILSLPIYPDLSQETILKMVALARSFYKK